MGAGILVTQVGGAGWRRIFDGRGHTLAYFERTGCLLTIDGSEDDKVKIRGTSYSVKPMKAIDQQLFCLNAPYALDAGIEATLSDHTDHTEEQVLVTEQELEEDECELVHSKEPLEQDEQLVVLEM